MTRLTILQKSMLFYGASLPDHPRKWWIHERLRSMFKILIDEELDVVRKGLTWRLSPADYTDTSLFWLGSRDDWDLFHLKRFLKPGVTIFDAGANFGYYSLLLAKALNCQCRVLAFEPDPLNFARLGKHISSNKFGACVQPISLGLSDREETVRMRRPKENSGHSTVDADGESGAVQLTTLNRYCQDKKIDRLDLLILDVEGYELRALHGAGEVLSRFSPLVFVELFPPVMCRQGASPEEVISLLEWAGYKLFVARKNRLIPLLAVPSGDGRENVFAFHEKHIAAGMAPSI